MNLSFANVVALSRALLSLSAVSLLLSCATPQTPAVATSDIFDLTEEQRLSRFPKVQKIGVVDLSGSQIKTRPFSGAKDEKEYLATGGALLVKHLKAPIEAYAPEILVTPEAAILRGLQASVRQSGRLITAESEETEFIIDGEQVKINGPHIIRNQGEAKISLVAGAAKKLETATPKVAPKKTTVPAQVITRPQPSPTSEVVAAPKKSVVKQAAKPATKPVVKSAAPVDRKELLNLMREPSE